MPEKVSTPEPNLEKRLNAPKLALKVAVVVMLPLKLSPEIVPVPMMLALPKLKAPTSGL